MEVKWLLVTIILQYIFFEHIGGDSFNLHNFQFWWVNHPFKTYQMLAYSWSSKSRVTDQTETRSSHIKTRRIWGFFSGRATETMHALRPRTFSRAVIVDYFHCLALVGSAGTGDVECVSLHVFWWTYVCMFCWFERCRVPAVSLTLSSLDIVWAHWIGLHGHKNLCWES